MIDELFGYLGTVLFLFLIFNFLRKETEKIKDEISSVIRKRDGERNDFVQEIQNLKKQVQELRQLVHSSLGEMGERATIATEQKDSEIDSQMLNTSYIEETVGKIGEDHPSTQDVSASQSIDKTGKKEADNLEITVDVPVSESREPQVEKSEADPPNSFTVENKQITEGNEALVGDRPRTVDASKNLDDIEESIQDVFASQSIDKTGKKEGDNIEVIQTVPVSEILETKLEKSEAETS